MWVDTGPRSGSGGPRYRRPGSVGSTVGLLQEQGTGRSVYPPPVLLRLSRVPVWCHRVPFSVPQAPDEGPSLHGSFGGTGPLTPLGQRCPCGSSPEIWGPSTGEGKDPGSRSVYVTPHSTLVSTRSRVLRSTLGERTRDLPRHVSDTVPVPRSLRSPVSWDGSCVSPC